MLQKIFSIKVRDKHEMARLEEVVVGLLGGEHHRCSFLRSGEYIRLRNKALYFDRVRANENDTSSFSAHSVYLEGLRITLTSTRTVCVYLTDVGAMPLPVEDMDDKEFVAKKRRRDIPALDSDSACDSEGDDEPLIVMEQRRQAPVDAGAE